jgi:serine/threonine-protein kinase
MVPSHEVVSAKDEKNGFIYIDFTNSQGQTSKGWIKKQDLILYDNTRAEINSGRSELTDTDLGLKNAQNLLNENQLAEALVIYQKLADQQVPEAMFHYGHLSLKNKNQALDCKQGLKLLEDASNKGYAPAKRILGFLYLFAENRDILMINEYDHCSYDKNFAKGSQLLMDAALNGDTIAKSLLDEINLQPALEQNGQLRDH